MKNVVFEVNRVDECRVRINLRNSIHLDSFTRQEADVDGADVIARRGVEFRQTE